MTRSLVAVALAGMMLAGCSNMTNQQQRALSGGAVIGSATK